MLSERQESSRNSGLASAIEVVKRPVNYDEFPWERGIFEVIPNHLRSDRGAR